MYKLVYNVQMGSTMVARWRQRNGYLQHFFAMEIEVWRDDREFIEEDYGVSFVECRPEDTYFFNVRSRAVDVVLPSLMVIDRQVWPRYKILVIRIK